MSQDLEPRLLRYFVAVAEELHFSRAARRLYIAQQVLSREIRRLEERVGAPLLERSTRRVALTPAGAALLVRARELLALHDTTLRELRELRGERRGLLVDVVGPDLTPARVLRRARELAPGTEFFARFHTGTESAAPLVLSGALDVTFGRGPVLAAAPGTEQRTVRYERFAVLVPERHPLARRTRVPLAALGGQGVCVRAGDHATPGWEHAALQLLAPFDPDPDDAHPHVRGGDELARHVTQRDAPVLTLASQLPLPGTVLRPLTEPVALFPWHMLWRAALGDDPGLRALHDAAAELGRAGRWSDVPAGAWLPEPEVSAAGAGPG
ncbi:LysR family transcriptional regulator [Actinacidiphila alni]|uniref:LysR family transcriptional regulator n=1 Tax=Actinacidiphila alni TaxID=380248 RepID=UPI0033C9B2B2